ncbi:MAG: recombinase family protein [Candidatus Hydrogenedentes bacterium]|nr:recombinase family protein [Candidatus Hydrogenedentota bacterium]
MDNKKQRKGTQSKQDEGASLSHGAKVKRGQLNSVQHGNYGTGPAPFGYRRGGKGEAPLMIEPKEVEIVRMIFREYLRQRSTGRVVDMLNMQGITTRKGKKWSRQAIAIILENRTYRGRVKYGSVEAQGRHEPIIEPKVFYKANALKNKRSRRRRRLEREAAAAAKASAETEQVKNGN